MIFKIIGVCWMVGPLLMLLVPKNNIGELLPYAAFSFICGFFLYKAAPKKQKKRDKLSFELSKPKPIIEKTKEKQPITEKVDKKFFNEDDEKYKSKESAPIKKLIVSDTIAISENDNITTDQSLFKYVRYDLNFSDINSSYPIVKIPLYNSVVRSHTYGRLNRRGFKEEDFQELIGKYFNNFFEISGSVILNTGNSSRPYEPDIALIGYSKLNIRIDVEIDEPYAGITRKPTHCISEDIQRDNYFKDRGWIVLRFSELQVHTQPLKCLNIIYRLIKKIDTSIFIEDLEQFVGIQRQNSWSLLQAQEWEKDNFRENYLNHRFELLNEHKSNYDRNLNSQELKEEDLVEASYTGKEEQGLTLGFNKSNYSKRDNEIKFYPNEHLYKINGIEFQSVSTLVNKFFPEFNAFKAAENLNPNHPLFAMEIPKIIQCWKEKGKKASSEGTFLHLQIEKYFLEQKYERTEGFHHFENFINEHKNLEPYRSEWRIFDSEYNVAGTIDLIVKDENEFSIYDWKRSKSIINSRGELIRTNQWQRGIGVLNHLDDTSYNRYCLQQSLYKYILENNYALSIKKMYLIVLHPKYGNYYKIEVPYLEEEVKSILNSL